MNDWLILLLSLLSAAFIGSYTILMYDFTHFESAVVGMIAMLFVYIMLRMNRVDRKLYVLSEKKE